MSIFGPIYNALAGLNGFSKSLENMSNNIANMNTLGYKGTDVYFEELGYRGGDNGFGNLDQLKGDGVLVVGEGLRMAQGDLQQTNNQTDMAIDGDGLFILQENDHFLYTRAGQFTFNQDGVLVDKVSGLNVMGLLNSTRLLPINIDASRFVPAEATTEITFSGNLNRATSIGDVIEQGSGDKRFSFEVIDAAGQTHEYSAAFERRTNLQWDVYVTDEKGNAQSVKHTIEFDADGRALNDKAILNFGFQPYTLEQFARNQFAEDQTITITDADLLSGAEILMEPFDFNLLQLGTNQMAFTDSASFELDARGNLVNTASPEFKLASVDDDKIVPFDISELLTSDVIATSEIELSGALNSSLPIGSVISADAMNIEIYNSAGDFQVLKTTFTKLASSQWQLRLLDENDVELADSSAIFFNIDTGNYTGSDRIRMNVPDGDTNNSLAVDFVFRTLNGSFLFTQEANPNASVVVDRQNGRAEGNINALVVKADGSTSITYTNGETVAGPKIAIVSPSEISFEPLTFDFSEVSVINTQAQISSTNDGKESGHIESIDINRFGELSAKYSNGDENVLAQIALAWLGNTNDLIAVGGANFTVVDPSRVNYGRAGDLGFGFIEAGSIELSNVELSREFADIIIAQRGFQASSQVLNVTNEMIQELYGSVSGR